MSGSIFLGETEFSVTEADGTVLVPIVRTGDLSSTATIQFDTEPLTATAGVDYVATSGTITMAAGQDRVLVPVKILDDGGSEPTESFSFSIVNVDSGSTLLFPRTAQIDILDEQSPVPVSKPPLISFYHVTEQPIIQGLNQPINFKFSPVNPSIVYIPEKGGEIKVFDLSTKTFLPDFVDLSAQVNDSFDRGIIDIALHPDFIHNPYVYVSYAVDPPDTAGQTGNAGPDGGGNRFWYVERFTADAATNYTTMVPGSGVILEGGAGKLLSDISGGGAVDSTSDFTQPESGFNAQTGQYVDNYLKVDSHSHVGGSLAFGPDGMLYISTGDGTSFDGVDPRTLSVQNINSLSGKILRVDPMTGLGLPDNPFFHTVDSGTANRDKVYELGFRNPFSMGFDQDGHLWISNTGWNSWEAIDLSHPGANFGWPYFEGGDSGVLLETPGYQNLSTASAFYTAVNNGTIDVTPAFQAFSHSDLDPGFQIEAITAGDVIYTGTRYPAFQNDFFFTDIVRGNVFVVDTSDRRDVSFLYQTTDTPVHFSQGPDGYVYYAGLSAGVIGRLLIEPATSTSPASIISDYLAITHSALSLNDATTIANAINAGTQTVTQYINGLLSQVANTTIPAVAVEASMYGVTGTSAEITSLVVNFLPAQVSNAIANGLNPQVYACEALGLAFAFGNETGSTAFASNFGLSFLMPNTAVFASAACNAIFGFGAASTANLVSVMQTFVSNWDAFYTAHGVPGLANPTAAQIDLAARGAAWGDMVGVALANNIGPLSAQVVNFLEDAAQGTAVYGALLVGQPAHQPFA
jgi:glucose/arabinose dehydrogenase